MYTCDRQSITHCARQTSVYEVLCPTLSVSVDVPFSSIMYAYPVHVYLYMYVIHCWNGCNDMFYNCVIFVILIFVLF